MRIIPGCVISKGGKLQLKWIWAKGCQLWVWDEDWIFLQTPDSAIATERQLNMKSSCVWVWKKGTRNTFSISWKSQSLHLSPATFSWCSRILFAWRNAFSLGWRLCVSSNPYKLQRCISWIRHDYLSRKERHWQHHLIWLLIILFESRNQFFCHF